MIVATRPEPTVRPPSRSDFAYLETYLLRFLLLFDEYLRYFTYYLAFFRGNVSDSYHAFEEVLRVSRPFCPCPNDTVFVHLEIGVAWSNRNVK